MKTIYFLLLATLLIVGLSSCGYKKSVGDKVYIQYVDIDPPMRVVHSRPDCPNLDSYYEESLKDCYTTTFFITTVCAKCVKEEDVHKILH